MAVWSALIIGSMTPDLPYFLPRHALEGRTHSLISVIWFNLPAGIVAYLVWEHWLRGAATFLLPRDIRRRLPSRSTPPSVSFSLVMANLVLGCLTHIGWDACTHGHGALVRAWPVMRHVLWDAWGYRVRTFKLLQHASTLGGGAVLCVWIQHKLRTMPPAASDPAAPFSARARLVVWVLMATALATAMAYGVLAAFPIDSIRALERFAGPASVVGVVAVVVPLLAFAILWQVRKHMSHSDARVPS